MPPTLIADRYHVLRELGRGGMGVVYQVLQKDTGEQYALKVLLAHTAAKGDSVERFKRELKLPARIKSEHVVQVVDSGEVKEEDGAPFYVMELLRGCDLRKLLDTNHPFTAQEIIWILRQLAHGLSRAHEIGIVHRDLKPDNIFLHYRADDGLVVKLLDFGIARYAQELLETGDQGKLTATQAMLGTPLYMAPEQAKGGEGRAEIGPCTDIWALGMIVFELLTGKTYWTANSVVAHLGQLLFGKMVPASQRAPEVPSGFDAWFCRACNRDSSQRHPSIAEQVDELARLLAKLTVDREPPAALLAAVKKQMPPLVDHRRQTMMVSGAPQGENEETRVFGQHKLLLGSAEQSLRAEIFSGPQAKVPTGSVLKPKIRTVLGSLVLVSFGVFALVISMRKSTTSPDYSQGAMDGGAKVSEIALRPDLAVPADLALSSQSAPTVAVRKPSGSHTKRPTTPKLPKTPAAPAPTDDQPKARRTYIPLSL